MPNVSERARAAAHAKWNDMTEEQRRAGTAAATAARRTAAQRIAELEERFGGELDSLRAEVADLRQRVAA